MFGAITCLFLPPNLTPHPPQSPQPLDAGERIHGMHEWQHWEEWDFFQVNECLPDHLKQQLKNFNKLENIDQFTLLYKYGKQKHFGIYGTLVDLVGSIILLIDELSHEQKQEIHRLGHK